MYGFVAVIAVHVAYKYIQRDVIFFRPSVYGNMRFGQHHHSGDAALLAKLVEALPYCNQASFLHLSEAMVSQRFNFA